jgi:hypothetical protein
MLRAMSRFVRSLVPCVALLVGGCAFDESLQRDARLTCNDDAECVDGTRCAVDGVCRDPAANTPPTVVVGTIERSIGLVRIPVTVFDLESDPASIDVELEKPDGTRVPIAVTDNEVQPDPDGVEAALTWSPLQFPANEYFDGLVLHATARSADADNASEPASSPTFAYGNTPPELREVIVPPVVSGRVPVVLRVLDREGDAIKVVDARLECISIGNASVKPVAIALGDSINGAPNDGRVGLEFAVSAGVEQVVGLVWESAAGNSNVNRTDVCLTVTLQDAMGAKNLEDVSSTPFTLANGPSP